MRELIVLILYSSKVIDLQTDGLGQLEFLSVSYTPLVVLNTKFLVKTKFLMMYESKIAELDVFPLKDMTVLDIRYTPIKQLDVRQLKQLKTVYCDVGTQEVQTDGAELKDEFFDY